jgi:hypothetical protein
MDNIVLQWLIGTVIVDLQDIVHEHGSTTL